MVGLQVDLAPWLERTDGSFAAVFRSGLKLDQAGLELANVGIVQLFVREGSDNERGIEGRLTGTHPRTHRWRPNPR